MKVKVTLPNITIEHKNVAELQSGDVKVFGDSKGNNIVVISFAYFRTLEKIFKLVRKGLDDFDGDFEFEVKN